jgi:signal transduction histidine kinase
LKNIDLAFRSDGSVPVSGDPILLAQALSNLIDNALKYAPVNGAIEVAVLRRSDGTAQVSVSDNGPGIAESEKSKVVERFYRGDASRGTPGVGLGLSLVQAVAKLHGSALELSDQNPGLRVALTISLDAATSVAVATSPPAAASGDGLVSATVTS